MQPNTPKLRFPEFNDNWKFVPLGNVFERINSKNKENNLNVLTISAQQGLINQEKFFTKSVSASNLTGYYLLHIGDFAYNKSYSNGYPFGAIKKLRKFNKGVVSTLYICFKPKADIESDYFEKYFDSGKHNHSLSQIVQEGARNHGLLNLSVNDFFNLVKVAMPSRPEQKKMALFFENIDLWILNLNEQKNYLMKFKKNILQNILSQEIKFKDEKGKEFPKWKLKKLNEVLTEQKERNKYNKYNEVFSVAKVKGIINQIEHLGRSFSSSNISNYKVVNEGDIVYTKSPTASFPYGIIKQNRLNRTGVVSVLYAVYKPINKYLGFLLHSYFSYPINTFNYLNPLVHKGAKNTLNIGNGDFLNGKDICLPVSELEQQKIAEFLISIDKVIESKQKQIELTESWKKGLMQEMFV